MSRTHPQQDDRGNWHDVPCDCPDPSAFEAPLELIAHLARTAELRAQGCTCTPGRLMDGGGPIYAEDATCPVHGTPLPEEPHHRAARQPTDEERAAARRAALDSMRAGLPGLREKAARLSGRHSEPNGRSAAQDAREGSVVTTLAGRPREALTEPHSGADGASEFGAGSGGAA